MQIYIYFLIVKQYLKMYCNRKFILPEVILPDSDTFIITFIDVNKVSCTLGPSISLVSFSTINKGDNKFL